MADNAAENEIRGFCQYLSERPDCRIYWRNLAFALWEADRHREAARVLRRLKGAFSPPASKRPLRSIVIPVLDYSVHSPFDIVSLLDDLKGFDGEIICIFNSASVFAELRDHPRIDKFSFNKHNVGVARSWNMGINQAEGDVIFILNADLKVLPGALALLERSLLALPRALAVGISGDVYDLPCLKAKIGHSIGSFNRPLVVDALSGYAFALHAARLNDAGISFDPRLSPYFFEELDLAMKAREAGYEVYAAPIFGIEHVAGVSENLHPIVCFGQEVDRLEVLIRNANILLDRFERIASRASLPNASPRLAAPLAHVAGAS